MDTFHEVKRKRDKRKVSYREPVDARWRPSIPGRGGRSGRGIYPSRSRHKLNDNDGQRNPNSGKENGIYQVTDKGNASSSPTTSEMTCIRNESPTGKEANAPDHPQISALIPENLTSRESDVPSKVDMFIYRDPEEAKEQEEEEVLVAPESDALPEYTGSIPKNATEQWDPDNEWEQWDPNANRVICKNSPECTVLPEYTGPIPKNAPPKRWDPDATELGDSDTEQWDPDDGWAQWDPNANSVICQISPECNILPEYTGPIPKNAPPKRWDPDATDLGDSDTEQWDPDDGWAQWDPNANSVLCQISPECNILPEYTGPIPKNAPPKRWDPDATDLGDSDTEQWDPDDGWAQWDPNANGVVCQISPECNILPEYTGPIPKNAPPKRWDPDATDLGDSDTEQWDPNANRVIPVYPGVPDCCWQ